MVCPILVIGSSNTDMVVKTARLPAPGETVLGGTFFQNPGGKGANQAVAAARLGGAVTFVCRVGADALGEQAVAGYAADGIDTRYVVKDPAQPSGVALISVSDAGENCIVVAPGANAHLAPTNLDPLRSVFAETDLVLLQLEISLDTVLHAVNVAHELGKRVVLNPAPAATLPDALYPKLYAITPNETEAALLTNVAVHDVASARQAAETLRSKGVPNVLITLGAQGVYCLTDDGTDTLIPAPAVRAVDTTAAGDVFNGALAVRLAEGAGWPTAAEFACRAGALSVTRLGAQASVPQREEL